MNVWECRTHRGLFAGRCWHARCRSCGTATAFDFTREEAVEMVQANCRCEA